MTKRTADALTHCDDNAVMQSDDAKDPDDPPAGCLFIILRMDRCLTSDRKGWAGVSWRNRKIRSQTIREPTEVCYSPYPFPLPTCPLSTAREEIKKVVKAYLNFLLPFPNCQFSCLLHILIYTRRGLKSLISTHTHLHVQHMAWHLDMTLGELLVRAGTPCIWGQA